MGTGNVITVIYIGDFGLPGAVQKWLAERGVVLLAQSRRSIGVSERAEAVAR